MKRGMETNICILEWNKSNLNPWFEKGDREIIFINRSVDNNFNY